MLRANAILQEMRANAILQELRESVVLQELRENVEGEFCSTMLLCKS